MSSRIILAILLSLSPAFAENPEDDSPGAKLFSVKCAACHGSEAAGDPKHQAPSIASLPEWYLARQIDKFQKDIRGDHEKDEEGRKMHSLAKPLTGEELLNIATFIPHLAKEHAKDRHKE